MYIIANYVSIYIYIYIYMCVCVCVCVCVCLSCVVCSCFYFNYCCHCCCCQYVFYFIPPFLLLLHLFVCGRVTMVGVALVGFFMVLYIYIYISIFHCYSCCWFLFAVTVVIIRTHVIIFILLNIY